MYFEIGLLLSTIAYLGSLLVAFSLRPRFEYRVCLFALVALLAFLGSMALLISKASAADSVPCAAVAGVVFPAMCIWDYTNRRKRAEEMWQHPSGLTKEEMQAAFSLGHISSVTGFYVGGAMLPLMVFSLFIGVPALPTFAIWSIGVLLPAAVLARRFQRHLLRSLPEQHIASGQRTPS
ncbi:MAG: hypothetical protein KKA73_23840 [Chloroflexi bacterium]|nr:hypothetical protein [Chloroflexota bacterium]MBU1750725.1 hypothetical protein [Chloroflexota bacterium]MBU1878984.1 hypothetical protein [Chloroflexota bacterium]